MQGIERGVKDYSYSGVKKNHNSISAKNKSISQLKLTMASQILRYIADMAIQLLSTMHVCNNACKLIEQSLNFVKQEKINVFCPSSLSHVVFNSSFRINAHVCCTTWRVCRKFYTETKEVPFSEGNW